jgi:magnesium transporter
MMLNFTFICTNGQWLDYANPTQEEIHTLQEKFGLHNLAIEQCLSPHIDRPKLIHFEGNYFFLDNIITYNKQSHELEVHEVGYFVGKDFLISLHRHPTPLLQNVLQHIQSEPETSLSIDRIFYLILDESIDQQLIVLNTIDHGIDALERTILAENFGDVSFTFFRIKKNLIRAKKILAPRRDCFTKLIRYNERYMDKEHQVYYLDIYDHALRALDTVQTQIDTLNGVLEIYLTRISNRTNETMKTLTLLATLAVPVTIIATVYGMNFKSIPEFDWPYGYAYFWGLTAITTAGLYLYLKKRNWF